MRALLTGATGFIGSHVAKELVSRGVQVTVLAREGSDHWRIQDLSNDLSVVHGDIENGAIPDLAAIAPEVCLHVAWYCEAGDYRDSPRNAAWVSSSMKLLQNLSLHGCRRLVITGSCFEYAQGPGLFAESATVGPINVYAAAKHTLHLLSERFCTSMGMSMAWARIFYLYGPMESEKRLVPYVARKLLAGERCPLTRGTRVRDFLHVRDVAGAICDVAESEVTGAVNIGSGIPVTVAQLASEIGRQTGREELVDLGAQQEDERDPLFYCADQTRLMRETSWRPKFDLSSGISDAVEWWRHRGAEPRL